MEKENQEWSSFTAPKELVNNGLIYYMAEKELIKLQVTTKDNGWTIVEYCFTGHEGNVNLVYSPDGMPLLVAVTENCYDSSNCSIHYDVKNGGYEVLRNPEFIFDTSFIGEGRIYDRDNCFRLGIKQESALSLIFRSDSWTDPHVRVDLTPVDWQRLLPLSPAKWQDSKGQELMVKIFEGIVREKLTGV